MMSLPVFDGDFDIDQMRLIDDASAKLERCSKSNRSKIELYVKNANVCGAGHRSGWSKGETRITA
jgi:hypothetical protein